MDKQEFIKQELAKGFAICTAYRKFKKQFPEIWQKEKETEKARKELINKEMSKGVTQRTAYRHLKAELNKQGRHQNWDASPRFNYDKETPKGEWI